MARHVRIWALFAAAAMACSGSGSSGSNGKGSGDGKATAAPAEPVVTVGVRPLGKATLDEYAWRRGAGKPAFDRALAAERRGDLATVERECADALVADGGHLEAAWMLAVARVRLGKHDQVLAPLEIAASGDWAKWGERSLELAVFEPFRKTPTGKGWARAAEGYRQALAAALADSVIVVGRIQPFRPPRATGDVKVEHRAEAYAVSGESRWIRLTRTGGALAGALAAPGRGRLAYATYREVVRTAGKPRLRELRVGVVDLGTGLVGRELAAGDVTQATLAWAIGNGEPELVVELAPAKGKAEVFDVDGDNGSRKLRAGGIPRGDALRVRPLSAERRRLPAPGVTADWDEAATASAVRLDRSRKVVTPPEGAMIDGHSLTWSPDQSRLAFSSVAEDPCGDAAARQVSLYVADAGSGRVRTLAVGDRVPSPVWVGTTRLAFVDGDDVRVIDVADGKDVARVTGGAGVTTGVIGETRPCAVETDGLFAAAPDEEEDDDSEELPETAATGAIDAGIP